MSPDTLPENVILIANHMTPVDWIYVWLLAQRKGSHGIVKIIMKDSLRSIPIMGWGMQFFEFIFLKRNWSEDQLVLGDALDKMAREHRPMWLMLFPEGTLISDQTMEINLKYAAKAGITVSGRMVGSRSS